MKLRTIVAFGILRAIQIVFFPVVLIGYVVFVGRLILYSRRSGISATVLASFYTRWMQHTLGTRRDDACARLMMVLPQVSHLGLRLVTGPTLLAHSLTGHVPKIYRYPYPGVAPLKDQTAARTTFFDLALQRHLGETHQLVVLGAGLDTRAYRPEVGTRVRCFEVDTHSTQAFKRDVVQRAALDTARVTYVAADFERQDWLEKLVEAGFDPDKPTFFVWESVTMYLTQDAVESTLRKIAGTARGSAVAFDYFSADLIEDRSIFMRYTRAVVNAVGEPFKFGIDSTPPIRRQVAALVESCGLVLEEQRNFGQETDRKRVAAGFASARV